MRPPIMVVLALTLLLVACGREPNAPGLQGVYALRSVGPWTPPYAALSLPASIAGALPGDTIRYLSGAFVLTANGRWHERVVREVVGGGSLRRDTLGGDGSYRVTTDTLQRRLLDLYPGLPYIAIINSIAVISGDTLYHAPWIFVR